MDHNEQTLTADDVKQTHRRTLVGVVSVGSLSALAFALGDSTLSRVGVGVAVMTAVIAAVLGVRYLAEVARENRGLLGEVRHAHANELRAQTQRHHDESMATIERFVARNRINHQTIEVLRNGLVATVGELTTLQVSHARTKAEAVERSERIEQLERAVEMREQQILTVMAGDEASEGAELFLLPRRAQSNRRGELPSAFDIWAFGTNPVDIDVDMLPVIMDAPHHNVG
ncbi:MAG TPA: hypothetical protein VLR88_09065 [Propionibacteriaceae bacterium]|nr:hypothetical protein [Propionibacteriaceae bacterium]